MKIGEIELHPCKGGDHCSYNGREPSGSVEFKAKHCIDSNLTTSCRPEELKFGHMISVRLLGPPDLEFDVKSVTIYTPPHGVTGYTRSVHNIKVGK